MNPKLPQHVIDKALAEDESKAGAEYLNRFREDSSDFISLDLVESCSDLGIHERPPSGPSNTSLTATQQAAPAPIRSRSRPRIASTIRMTPFG